MLHRPDSRRSGSPAAEPKRSCLRPGQSLCLSIRADGSVPERYTILSTVGEGGSAVCYEAVRERDGQPGKLKEFYPISAVVGDRRWSFSLQRQENGQLLPTGTTAGTFSRLCREYLDAYRLLNRVAAENPDNRILKNYIRSDELLYGCGDPESPLRPTVYVWTADMAGQSFDAYLREVRASPEQQADRRLHDILRTLVTLTDCIKALHTAGLLHLDIKPANFLVAYDSEFRINTGSISLYDVNSIFALGGTVPRFAGTPGFRAPELAMGEVDNRSDLYSIGAMLFHATVITDEVPDGLYRDEYYPRLEALLTGSRLITASDANSNGQLMALLTEILRRCLAVNPDRRYDACSQLLHDLQKAEQRARPQEKRTAPHVNDPVIVLQKLLHEVPLPDTGRDLQVLTLGCGTYGRKFMDQCLQAGQMPHRSLSVTAVSDKPEQDRQQYLQARPAAGEFLNIDGAPDHDPRETLGSIRFLNRRFQRGDSAEAAAKNRELARQLLAERPYDYIFIALGSDAMNRRAAECFADAGCPVCYITYKAVLPTGDGPLHPVSIHAPVTPGSIDPQLEQMAFNTHLIWSGGHGPQGLEQFRQDKYNYASSLAFALSIPYKLRSIGIRQPDPLEAALCFDRQVLALRDTDPEAARKFDTLTALEHRRWILHMVSEGWQPAYDLDACVRRGSVKDPQGRTHPCLVRSTGASALRDPSYEADNRKKWDEGPLDPALDPLDRMSVTLHRLFKAKADSFRANDPLRNEDLEALEQLMGTDEAARTAFAQYRFCLQSILEGVESVTGQYGRYADELRQAAKALPEETQARVEERLALLKRAFFPVIEANLYRNYKENDEALLAQLPLILTRRPCETVGVVLSDPAAAAAMATVLQPRRLLLACRSETLPQNWDALKACAAVTELAVACPPEEEAALKQRLGKQARLLVCRSAEETAEKLAEFLSPAQLVDTTAALLPEEANALFLRKLSGKGLFTFDPVKRRFPVCRNCGRLQFLRDTGHFRVARLPAFTGAAPTLQPPRPTGGQEALWEIFLRSRDGWPELCRAVGDYEAARPPLAVLPLEDGPAVPRQWLLPDFVFEPLRRLLRRLETLGLPRGTLRLQSGGTCRLELTLGSGCAAGLSALLSQAHLLHPYYQLQAVPTGKAVALQCFQPSVTGLPEAVQPLLRQLRDAQLISGLTEDGSFFYGSPDIAALLQEPDALLRQQLWDQVLKYGGFDDAACCGPVLLLTKGFRAMAVLATAELPTEAAAQTLARVAAQFGPAVKQVHLTAHGDLSHMGKALAALMDG